MTSTHFPTLVREHIAALESERADLTTELDKLAADEITARANEIAARAGDIDLLLTANRYRLTELDGIESARAKAPTGAPNFIRGGNPWGDMATDRDTASEVRSRAIAGIERWDADDALNGTPSEIDSAGEAFTAAEICSVLEDLPPRFRENAA